MEPNYYDILGVDKNATEEELRKAFRRAQAKNHPDTRGDNADWAFLMVQSAYEVLKDPASREQYDATLNAPKTPESKPAPQQQKPTPQEPSQPSQQPPQASSQPQQANTSPASKNASQAAKKPSPVSVDNVVGQISSEPITDLEGWHFVPGEKESMKRWIVSLIILLILGTGAMLIIGAPLWTLAVIAVGACLLGAVPFIPKDTKDKRLLNIAMGFGVALAVLPLPLSGMMSRGTAAQNEIFFGICCGVASAAAIVFGLKYQDERLMNKLVPIETLRKGRVFGEPAATDPAELAARMNIRAQLAQIPQQHVDGSFLLCVPPHEKQIFSNTFVLTRANQVFLVYCEAQGDGQLSMDGRGLIMVNGAYVPTSSNHIYAVRDELARRYKKKQITLVYSAIGASEFATQSVDSENVVLGTLNQNMVWMSKQLKNADKIVDRVFLKDAFNGFRSVD